MKKFLSLLLALVMTMSLVTISAGATEYKDLTDKDELGPQYQEAVAVLNKIGVITGYDDGSFRPDVKLTRGAAAKIIVSLLIGPEAANNLPNNYAPYPDVPANHTFAGVISYCKTKGIISGYGDGTFKPANDLTGYAFAKMLLGALGYDATIEKFVDTGWTMNVLNIGQEATLFDRLDFKGSEAVTRKDAALLALNTLKATVVEYKEGLNINVTGENTNVTVKGDQARDYKTSNQDYARNILPQRRNAQINQGSDWFTVEFAEEHFVDLRLPHDKYSPIDDDFGRPSAEWSYKKLSIGKFPLVPDYEYNTQVIHNVNTVTDGAKVRALGLNGYSVTKDNGDVTNLWINGVGPIPFDGTRTINLPKGESFKLDSVADIANFTDNGTLVEVYVDNNGADFITDVVVVRTQLMEVRRVGSDFVSLDIYDDNSDADGDVLYGYNYIPIDEKVNNVEAEDECFEFLSGLKSGDKVAVVPVAVNHDSNAYDVAEAYTPETVTGALTGAETYGNVGSDRNAINLTVGGTKYNIALWNKDMREIDSDSIKVTKKDVTLYLDKYGNTMLATDVGATSNWMVIGNYRQGLVNGIVVTYANGWDIKGNEVSLNVGYQHDTTGSGSDWYEQRFPVGSLVYYTNDTTSNTAEWELRKTGIYNVSDIAANGTDPYTINSSSSRLLLKDDLAGNKVPDAYKMPFYVNNVPFIYLTIDKDGEVDSIEIKNNPQNVTNAEILGDPSFGIVKNAEAAISIDKKTGSMKPADDAGIEAVVIKKESSAVSINNLLYISNYHGSVTKDANGNMVQGYEVAMLGTGGKLVDRNKIIYSDRTDLKIGSFARYTEATREGFEDFYTLRPFSASNSFDTAGDSVAILKTYIAKTGADNAFVGANSRMVYLDGDYAQTTRASGIYKIETFQSKADTNLVAELEGNNDAVANLVNVRRAEWLDLTSYKQDIESPSELKDAYSDVTAPNTKATHHRDIQVTLLFNDNPDSDEFRQVYMVVVNYITPGDVANDKVGGSTGPVGPTDIDVVANGGVATGGKVSQNGDGTYNIDKINLTVPEWVYADSSVANTLTDVEWNLVKGDKKWFGTTMKTAAPAYKSASDKSSVTLTLGNTSGAALDADEKASVAKAISEGYKLTLTKVDWLLAKVEYTVNGKAGSFTSKDDGLALAGDTLSFQVATANTGTGRYTVKGIDTTDLAETAYKNVAITDMSDAQTTASYKAVYGQKVSIAITSTATLPITFALDTPIQGSTGVTVKAAAAQGVSINASETGKLTFGVNGTAGSANSATYTPTESKPDFDITLGVALDTIADTKVESYEVSVTVNGKTEKVTLAAGQSKSMFFKVSSDFTLKAADIKVTGVNLKKVQIDEGTAKAETTGGFDWLTVKLTGVDVTKITESNVVAAAPNGTALTALEVIVLDDNTIKIKFASGNLVADSVVAIYGSNAITVSRMSFTAPTWSSSDTVFVVTIGENLAIERAVTVGGDTAATMLQAAADKVVLTDAEKTTALNTAKTEIGKKTAPTIATGAAATADEIKAAVEALLTKEVLGENVTASVSVEITTRAVDGIDGDSTAQAGTAGSYTATINLSCQGATDSTSLDGTDKITPVAFTG